MKWRLSMPESPMPIYYWAKLIGLAPFTVKNKSLGPPKLIDKLYPIIVAVGYTAFISQILVPTMWDDIAKSVHVGVAKCWRSSLFFVNYMVTSYSIIVFVLSYEEILNVMNRLCSLGDELKTLGIPEDRGKLFKNLLSTLLTSNIVMIALGVTTYATDGHWHRILSLQFIIGCWFNLNVFLIYSGILFFIGKRFELLNERLAHLFFPNDFVAFNPNSRMVVIGRILRGDDSSAPAGERLSDLQMMRKIAAVHLDLCDLIDRTAQLFAIPILLTTYELLAMITLSCHWIYVRIRDLNRCSVDEDLTAFMIDPILCPILRILMLFYETSIFVNASAACCKRGNDTAAVLFKVWKKFKPVELKDEFITFSVQMMQEPIVASARGIVDLDQSFIYKIVCTAIAYLVIVIPLDRSRAGCV